MFTLQLMHIDEVQLVQRALHKYRDQVAKAMEHAQASESDFEKGQRSSLRVRLTKIERIITRLENGGSLE